LCPHSIILAAVDLRACTRLDLVQLNSLPWSRVSMALQGSSCTLAMVVLSVILVTAFRSWGADIEAQPMNAPQPVAVQASPAKAPDQSPPEPGRDIDPPTSQAPQTPQVLEPPDDHCLPPLYRDWQELSLDTRQTSEKKRSARVRIIIDRPNFLLTVQTIDLDGSAETIYRTHVALGTPDSPTPEGTFIVNHVYCYPDVVYFAPDQTQIKNLYEGFFAPLLLCDDTRRCQRFRDLGIHGYDSSAFPQSQQTPHGRYGPLSSGCIRVPDPCTLKTILVRFVGVGPVKKNDRGCYHWLKNPVDVVIEGDYPWIDGEATIASILQQGLLQVQKGLQSLFGALGP